MMVLSAEPPPPPPLAPLKLPEALVPAPLEGGVMGGALVCTVRPDALERVILPLVVVLALVLVLLSSVRRPTVSSCG